MQPRPQHANSHQATWDDATDAARIVAERLIAADQRIALAESCTSGLMAATIGSIPGVSAAFCGSSVTYRDATKRDWLGIEEKQLDEFTAVSQSVTRQMALSLLTRTVEADWSLAITGHLGPGAPTSMDGQVHVAVASADRSTQRKPSIRIVAEESWILGSTTRHNRQFESCNQAWRFLESLL